MSREEKLIEAAIKKMELDLNGLTILTEVGSGLFAYTPIIAAMAGAKKVYAWTADSIFGSAAQNVERCKKLLESFRLANNIIEFAMNDKPIGNVKEADIITNLGFVRPLDAKILQYTKDGVAISYMCEAWEIREGDIDLSFCKSKGIRVHGVWENKPGLKIFDGCGPLANKLAFEAGMEVYQNDILIISSDHFGTVAQEYFVAMGASKVSVKKPSEFLEMNRLDSYDFIFLADFDLSNCLFSNEEILEKMSKAGIDTIVHLCGALDSDKLSQQGIRVYPTMRGVRKKMTKTLAYLGPKSLFDLYVAGFKVGENMVRNSYSDLNQIII